MSAGSVGAPMWGAIAIARLARGSGPGRNTATGHDELPGSAPPRIAANNSARASDDFPLPEGPMSARKRFSLAPGCV